MHATGRQSHAKIAFDWRPVACNMNKTDGNLPATGGHAGTICMRLAASRMLFFLATARQSHINYLPSCGQLHTFTHRVYRVPEFLASRLNWLPSLPSVSPPGSKWGGGTHSLGGEEVGGSHFRRRYRHMILVLFPSLCLHT